MKNYIRTNDGKQGLVGDLIDDLYDEVTRLTNELDSEKLWNRVGTDLKVQEDENGPITGIDLEDRYIKGISTATVDNLVATGAVVGSLSADDISGNDLAITRASDGKNIIQYKEELDPDALWIGDNTDSGDPINVIIRGDVYVSGTTTSINTKEMNVGVTSITLNSDYTGGVAVHDAYIIVNRGSGLTPAYIEWDESNDIWKMGLSGQTYRVLRSNDIDDGAYDDAHLWTAEQVSGEIASASGALLSTIDELEFTSLADTPSAYDSNTLGLQGKITRGTDELYTSSGTDQALDQPSPVYNSTTQFLPCQTGLDQQLIIGANRWAYANSGLGTLTGVTALGAYGSVYWHPDGANWNNFATSDNNGIQTDTLPKNGHDDGLGGSVSYYFHSSAWTTAFNGNASDALIAQTGAVYKDSISDANLVVTQNGEVGPAGGGSATPDGPTGAMEEIIFVSANLSGVTDVSPLPPISGDYLHYDGDGWVPSGLSDVIIDDYNILTDKTWSSDKIDSEITAAESYLYDEMVSISGALNSEITTLDTHSATQRDVISGALNGEISALDAHLASEISAVSGALNDEISALDAHSAAQRAAVSGALNSQISDLDIHSASQRDAVSGALNGQISDLSGHFETNKADRTELDAVSGEFRDTIDTLTIHDLFDTDAEYPNSGETLTWNGSDWIPVSGESGGGSTGQRVHIEAGSFDYPDSDIAPLNNRTVTNVKFPEHLFDDTTPETILFAFDLHTAGLDTAADVTFTVKGSPATADGNEVQYQLSHTVVADDEDIDNAAFTDEKSGDQVTSATQNDLNVFSWTESWANLGWTMGYRVYGKLTRIPIEDGVEVGSDYGVQSLDIDIPGA